MSPQVILLFSGKRKSGKDYLTDHLQQRLKNECGVIKISAPIKSYWAKENNLNLNELLSHNEYKEQYRLEMIRWSDSIRAQDYGYFCRQACHDALDKPTWIVSDIRRKTDICWFKETYKDLVKTIRIVADEETRKSRGFQYKDGIDNVASECDLDDYGDWDLVINNGEGKPTLQKQMESIMELCKNNK
ncbi:unnamed protein product [Chilo suppressalis]|uniref:Phosphomevalonate kinase n=1 Tax=Chilo suppressalis TaxID=168631 RepID=A0ABN8B268_CHISP|nr:unnamed protein product [Chilo suppressalis]